MADSQLHNQHRQHQHQQQSSQRRLELGVDEQRALRASLSARPQLIFYHFPCADGIFAALAAWLGGGGGSRQQLGRGSSSASATPEPPAPPPQRFIPHEVYREQSLDALQLQGDEAAFLLDYSGPDGFVQQLAARVAAVVVLDHHKTAFEQLEAAAAAGALPGNVWIHLDMQRSGATLARDFFLPPGDDTAAAGGGAPPSVPQQDTPGATAPPPPPPNHHQLLTSSQAAMFRFVEDADLWRWALAPSSRAFHAGLAAGKLEYHAGRNPGIFQQLLALDVDAVLAEGTRVLEHQQALVADAVARATPHQLGGARGSKEQHGWGAALGVEVDGELVAYRSSLGNALALASKARGLAPVGLVAYVEDEMPNQDSHIKVSLRSVDGWDTTAVSRACGGGGHAAASSCILLKSELAAWRELGGK